MAVVSLPDRSWIDDVGAVSGVEIVEWDGQALPPRPDIEVFVAPYLQGAQPVQRAIEQAPGLQLVQLLTAGFDGVFAVVPDRIGIANAGPVHDDSTAELALTLALAALRGIPQAVRAGEQGQWLDLSGRPSLADRRCLVIGYGGVGSGIARRLLAFGAGVTAVASRPRAGDDLVPTVHGIDDVPALLTDAEVVFLAVPLTEATRGLVDEAFLARMPPGALLVNVARGPVVDTSAMVRYVGRLRFALDVTDPEPLPPEHPLWSAPEMLISPHVGGATTAFRPRAVTLLRDQLHRLAVGAPVRHLVRTSVL